MLQGDEFEKFRIIRRLGGGGTGEVYLATDLRSYRHVALKCLSPEAMTRPAVREAFEREARVGRRLSHPNLASFIDGCMSGSQPWIAFEYVVGNSLEELIARNGPLEPSLAIHLALQIALGLAAAHQNEVRHGDLKPANVMVTASGSVKLIDFGAAHWEEDEVRQNPTQVRACTRCYTAPEYLQGKEVDEKADLYALGLVLYEMLTGRRVLDAAPPAQIILAQTSIPKSLPRPSMIRHSLPEELDLLVEGLLAFQPEKRIPQSAAAVADALETLANGQERDSAFRKHERHLARVELAETDYWRAMNHIDRGQITEGLALFKSLLGFRSEAGRPYKDRIRDDMLELLRKFDSEQGHDLSHSLLCERIDTLMAMSSLGRVLGDKDLLLLLERRVVSLSEGFKDPNEYLKVLTRLLTIIPWSYAVAKAILVTATTHKRLKTIAAIRLPLARICLETHDFRKAMALAMDEVLKGSKREEAAKLLRTIAILREKGEKAHKAFKTISSVLIAKQHFAESGNVCRKHLRDHPWDGPAWECFADLSLALHQGEEGIQALVTAARIAFTRGTLDEARRLLVRILRLDPSLITAYAFLYEVLRSLDCLPRTLLIKRRLRLAIFCQEGIALSGAADLDRELCGNTSDIPLLEALVTIAKNAGNGELEAAVQTRLAHFALKGGLIEDCREYFVAALEASPDPLGLLSAIGQLPGPTPIFTSFELLRLRRRLLGEDTASLRKTSRTKLALQACRFGEALP